MKCLVCNGEVIKLSTLDSGMADFAIEDEKKSNVKFSFSFNNVKKSSSGVIHGQVENAYYCEECKKAYVIYSDIE